MINIGTTGLDISGLVTDEASTNSTLKSALNALNKDAKQVNELKKTTKRKDFIAGAKKIIKKELKEGFYYYNESIEETVRDSFINDEDEDLIYNQNDRYPSDFVLKNLSRVVNNNNEIFQNFAYPNVLSHEIIKTNGFTGSLKRTNESSLLPNNIYKLKKDYYEKVQTPNAYSYFIFSENSKSIRENYVEELALNNNLIKNTYVDIKNIFNLKNNLKVKNNFGNKIVDFYLNQSISSSIGKLASLILDNDNISFNDRKINTKLINTSIDTFIYNDINENFNYFDNNEDSLKKIFDLKISSANTGNNNYLKTASNNQILLNTDRIIGQNLLNTSISMNGFYKDSLSYEFWLSKNTDSGQNSQLYLYVDSEIFFKVPIIKLDSLLSIETQSNALFNNFNNDKIYSLDESIFDLKNADENFNSESFIKKDKNSEIKTPPNRKVFDFFKENLYLENNFNKFSVLFPRYGVNNNEPVNTTIEVIKEKELFLTSGSDSYAKIFVNPFTVLNASIENTNNSDSQQPKFFNTYFTDISFLKHNFASNNEIIEKIKEKNTTFLSNTAKSILSGTKFLYFAGKNKNSILNQQIYNEKSKYQIPEVKYIFTGEKNKVNGITNFNNIIGFVRKPFNDSSISVLPHALRDYYEEENLYVGYDEDNANIENSINTIKTQGTSNDFISDIGFRAHTLGIFKGEDKYLKNSYANDYIKDQISSSRAVLRKGFALFKNTQNEISINDITQKFINYRDDLTKENEFINSRLIASSGRFNPNAEDRENVTLITDKLKNRSFNSNNTWAKSAFQLRRSLHDLKIKKLKRLNEVNFLNYINDFKNKAKEVRKINENTPYLTLLYSDSNHNCIDNIENSDFVFSSNGEKYKKFDFSENNDNIKNVVEYILESDNQSIDSFKITKDDILKFSSYYYTDSELKSSYTYFLNSCKNIFKLFKENLNYGPNARQLGYDKLLADSIINNDSKDLYLLLITSAILKYKNITEINDNFENLNDKTEFKFQKYLEKMYSFENIQRQNSFTLRIVDFPNTALSVFPDNLNQSYSTEDFAQIGVFSGRSSNIINFNLTHDFNCGVMPGVTYTLGFPFLSSTYDTNVTGNELKMSDCLVCNVEDGGYMITSYDKFKNTETSSQEALYDFIHSNFYNYDTYLDKSSLSLGENNLIQNTAFNTDKNKVCIYNIVRSSKGKGEFYFNENADYSDKIVKVSLAYNESSNTDVNVLYDNSRGYYKRWGVEWEDFAFSELNSQPKFKKYINDSIIEFLKFVDPDFNVSIEKVETLEDAVSYSKNFEDSCKSMFDLLKFDCDLYSTIFDLVVETSLFSSINDYINKNNTQNTPNFEITDLWKKSAFEIFEFEDIISDSKKFSFEETVKAENENSGLYLKLHADIGLIKKTLSNSDVLEVMSVDTLSSYLHEFDKFKSQNNSFLQLKSSVDNFEEKINSSNVLEVISNKCLLNVSSKKLNDYYYYQNFEFNKVNQKINQNLNVDLKNIFDDLLKVNDSESDLNSSFFGTLISKERNLSKLAFQGSYLTQLNNERYDIIRLGIDFNVANSLLDNKILKIKIHASNHKYPNVYIPALYKFYTPVFTDVVPSHFTLLESQGEGVILDDYIGFYNFDAIDLKERYSIVSFDQAVDIVSEILTNVNSERIFQSETDIINLDQTANNNNSVKIVIDAIDSASVKYSNYRSQKFIDEKNIKEIEGVDFVLSESANGKFSAMSKKDFEETFDESYDDAVENFDSDLINYTNLDVIEKQNHFVKFFNAITEYTSTQKLSDAFLRNEFYDVFSIIISRNDIERKLNNYYDSSNNTLVKNLINREDFYDSFTFTIEAEIV